MAVVGSSDPEEVASSCYVACAGTGVSWRSPGARMDLGTRSGYWSLGQVAWVYGLPRTEMLTFLDIFLLILTNPLEMSTEGD